MKKSITLGAFAWMTKTKTLLKVTHLCTLAFIMVLGIPALQANSIAMNVNSPTVQSTISGTV
ncbi:MAG: hypothetical protein HKP24_04300, partial [Croceitalea sp.]|nr:hypothetical protein [Croceitalea sp.]